jgi:uncharacterized protein YdaU (DUF1376 family)
MPKDKLPWYPLYPSDFDTDERVRGMTDEEVGFFIRLLNHCWINGSIPDDVEEIARIMGRDLEHARRLWQRVGQCFVAHPSLGGRLVNPRLEIERVESLRRTESARERARKRWSRDNHHAAETTSPRKALMIPEQSTDVSVELIEAFHTLADRYPNATGVDLAMQIWISYCEQGIITEQNVGEVFAGLERWKKSGQWTRDGGRYVVSLAKWISGKMWLDRPAPSQDEVEREHAPKLWRAPWKTEDGRIRQEYLSDERAGN